MSPWRASIFWARRKQELIGVSLFACAVLCCAIFVLASPHDVSLNVASDRVSDHPLGFGAAVFADMMTQFLGAARWLFLIILVFWGIKYVLKVPPLHFFWRLLAFFCALMALALFLHALAIVFIVDESSLLGGIVGKAAYQVSRHLFVWVGMAVPLMLAAFCVFLFSVFCLIYAFGLTKEEYVWLWQQCQHLARFFWRQLVVVVQFCRHGGVLFWRLMRGDFDREMQIFGRQRRSLHAVPLAHDKQEKTEQKNTQQDDVLATVETQLPQNTPKDVVYLPPLDLLTHRRTAERLPAEQEQLVKEQEKRLLETLSDFGVKGRMLWRQAGPVITIYAFEPAAGMKMARIVALTDDVARALSAVSVRIALVPGQNVIGIEVPLAHRRTVYLHDMLASSAYQDTKRTMALPLALGCSISGQPMITDLSDMPHMLVAGTTGSGKSVALNGMIMSLLYHCPPSKCRFLMIDPKRLELSSYEGIAHLLAPVVHEPMRAAQAFKWLVQEMERRYALMSAFGVRHIESYNRQLKRLGQQNSPYQADGNQDPSASTPLPFIVVIVDEVADVMLVAGRSLEASIQRLAQMARAAGIHIILATQRPSVDVLTGTIKANFPTRISFQVTTKIDSRTILGEQGAEKLLGQGDMLFMIAGQRLVRLHAPFVSDAEVDDVVAWLKSSYGSNDASLPKTLATDQTEAGGVMTFEDTHDSEDEDVLYQQAVALILRQSRASISLLQRHFQIGYNRAARMIEQMEQRGIVSHADHMGRRSVLRNIED